MTEPFISPPQPSVHSIWLHTLERTRNRMLHVSRTDSTWKRLHLWLRGECETIDSLDFACVDNYGHTLPMVAFLMDLPLRMETLLRECPLNVLTLKRQSLLHFAAGTGNLSFVEALLDNGVDETVKNAQCWTAARLAFECGYHDVAELLGYTPKDIHTPQFRPAKRLKKAKKKYIAPIEPVAHSTPSTEDDDFRFLSQPDAHLPPGMKQTKRRPTKPTPFVADLRDYVAPRSPRASYQPPVESIKPHADFTPAVAAPVVIYRKRRTLLATS